VIGVDGNLEMLALARRHRETVAERLGFSNVEFRCGLIQDLRLDLDLLADELARHPVGDLQTWLDLRGSEDRLRRERPMIADESVDCILSNCVLNLVRPQDRPQLFGEIFRVLKHGGRAAISDIIASHDVPEALQHDPQLWSGCVSGAFREDRFIKAFEDVGFSTVQVVQRQQEPWQTVASIEFRAVTVLAQKGSKSQLDLAALNVCCGPKGSCC
jgi:SAM-dependent methyltransferase